MMQCSVWLYRLLLWLYPADFRQRYGDLMTQAFRDRLRAARAVGVGAFIRGWLHALFDLLVNALAEQRTANPSQPTSLLGAILSGLMGFSLLLDSLNDHAMPLYLLYGLILFALLLRFPAWSLPTLGLVLAVPLLLGAFLFTPVIIVGLLLLMLRRRGQLWAGWSALPHTVQRILLLMGITALGGVVILVLGGHGGWVPMMLFMGVSKVLIVLICAPLARFYGMAAALLPLMAISLFYAGISDPAYFLGVINAEAGDWVWVVSMLPPLVCPPVYFILRGRRGRAAGILLIWGAVLAFCTIMPALIRAGTGWEWDTPVIIQRVVEAAHMLLCIALALAWYDDLHTRASGQPPFFPYHRVWLALRGKPRPPAAQTLPIT